MTRKHTTKSEPRVNSLFVSHSRSLRRRFSVLRGHLAPRFLYVGPCEWLQTLRLNSRDSVLILRPAGSMSTVILDIGATKSPQNALIFSGRPRPLRAYGSGRSCVRAPVLHFFGFGSTPGGVNSVGRVLASQAGCRGFESRTPLHLSRTARLWPRPFRGALLCVPGCATGTRGGILGWLGEAVGALLHRTSRFKRRPSHGV